MGLVRKYDHIFLDCGTTFVHLADAIFSAVRSLAPIRMYTTNLEVLTEFLKSADQDLIDLRLVGGGVIPHHRSLDGSSFSMPEGTKLFRTAFIGVSAIDERMRMMASITDAESVKRQMICLAEEVVILCDESKFGQPSAENGLIGSLTLSDDGKLHVSPEGWPGVLVPARIVIGTRKRNAPHPPEAESFLSFARTNGLLANCQVLLAPCAEDEIS
jgi:hypothetical protein